MTTTLADSEIHTRQLKYTTVQKYKHKRKVWKWFWYHSFNPGAIVKMKNNLSQRKDSRVQAARLNPSKVTFLFHISGQRWNPRPLWNHHTLNWQCTINNCRELTTILDYHSFVNPQQDYCMTFSHLPGDTKGIKINTKCLEKSDWHLAGSLWNSI